MGPGIDLDHRHQVLEGTGKGLHRVHSHRQHQVALSEQRFLEERACEEAAELRCGLVYQTLGVIGGENRTARVRHRPSHLLDPGKGTRPHDQQGSPRSPDQAPHLVRESPGWRERRRIGRKITDRGGVHVDVDRSLGMSRGQPYRGQRRLDSPRVTHRPAPLGQRSHHGGLIELLMSHPGTVGLRNGVAHQHQGLFVQGGLGHSVGGGSHSRTAGDHRRAH